MANEQSERPAHQHRNRRKQDDGDRSAGEVRGRRKDVPAARVAQVGGHERRDSTEVRQEHGDGKTHQADGQLEIAVRLEQRLGPGGVTPICPCSNDPAADAQAQHEHCDYEGGGVHGVAEDIAEHADPDDLIDQSAEA